MRGQGIDRRKESRYKLSAKGILKVLGAGGFVTGLAREVDIVEASNNGLRIRMQDGTLRCGTLVEIESCNTLALGEVFRCEACRGEAGESYFELAIRVSHRIPSTGEFLSFRRSLDEISETHNYVNV